MQNIVLTYIFIFYRNHLAKKEKDTVTTPVTPTISCGSLGPQTCIKTDLKRCVEGSYTGERLLPRRVTDLLTSPA